MKKLMIFYLAVILVLFAKYAFAQTGLEIVGMREASLKPFLQDINSPVGSEKIALKTSDYPPFVNKLSDGVINITTSWTEIPKKVVEKDNILSAGTVGLGGGVASGIGRAIAGTYDVTTAVVYPDEKSSVKAKYKVEDPQKEFKISILKW